MLGRVNSDLVVKEGKARTIIFERMGHATPFGKASAFLRRSACPLCPIRTEYPVTAGFTLPPMQPGTRRPGRRAHHRTTPGRRPLLQCPMRSMRVVVIHVFGEDQPLVPLAGDQHPVRAGHSRRALAIERSAIAFILGIRIRCAQR